ncbi:hypothetical protein D9756_007187 [Leucocoprinus leucothites]|uniref:Uncharacterized protein n=1 Tax=Leucocoprinus leucothites TaxID=201217 RepID=A0A8H5D6D6_9AGAR|nr:hypothetical protein D9756_007187 [Leucoagaricus leucothites]
MARETRKALGPILARRYYSAMVIIVESGAIYSLYVLTDEIIKMAAIAPTLIIIQVGFGRQARNIESTMRIGRQDDCLLQVLPELGSMSATGIHHAILRAKSREPSGNGPALRTLQILH